MTKHAACPAGLPPVPCHTGLPTKPPLLPPLWQQHLPTPAIQPKQQHWLTHPDPGLRAAPQLLGTALGAAVHVPHDQAVAHVPAAWRQGACKWRGLRHVSSKSSLHIMQEGHSNQFLLQSTAGKPHTQTCSPNTKEGHKLPDVGGLQGGAAAQVWAAGHGSGATRRLEAAVHAGSAEPGHHPCLPSQVPRAHHQRRGGVAEEEDDGYDGHENCGDGQPVVGRRLEKQQRLHKAEARLQGQEQCGDRRRADR